MARLISDEEEFRVKYSKSEANDLLLKLTLPQAEAKAWTKNGNFKHIRLELRQVQGLEVASQIYMTPSNKLMCHYYFMCPTPAMMDRIHNMITTTMETGKHIHLMDASTEPQGDKPIRYSTIIEAVMNPSCAIL